MDRNNSGDDLPGLSSGTDSDSEWDQPTTPTDDLANRQARDLQNLRARNAAREAWQTEEVRQRRGHLLMTPPTAAMNGPFGAFVISQMRERGELQQAHLLQIQEQERLEARGRLDPEALSVRRERLSAAQRGEKDELRSQHRQDRTTFLRHSRPREAYQRQRVVPPDAAGPDHHAPPPVPGGAADYNPQMTSGNGERGRPGAASGQRRPRADSASPPPRPMTRQRLGQGL